MEGGGGGGGVEVTTTYSGHQAKSAYVQSTNVLAWQLSYRLHLPYSLQFCFAVIMCRASVYGKVSLQPKDWVTITLYIPMAFT